jgi:hypothetical protein
MRYLQTRQRYLDVYYFNYLAYKNYRRMHSRSFRASANDLLDICGRMLCLKTPPWGQRDIFLSWA